MTLNPNAAPFVPLGTFDAVVKERPILDTAEEGSNGPPSVDSLLADDGSDVAPGELSNEELEELETTESWVRLMAFLEDLEREHLIALALKLTPASKIAEIQKRAAVARSPILKQRGSLKMRWRAG